MFGYYYHSTTRKYVVAFGTLFNNIFVSRLQENGESIQTRVPLAYAAKEKYVKRLSEFDLLVNDENNPGTGHTYLPRMSFELTNISYDPMRKRNSLSKTKVYEPTSNSLSYNYAEVPYNFEFTVNLLTRKMEDGLQVIEQILPFFTPEFTITMDLGEFAQGVDIPITLASYSQSIEYDGDADENMEHRLTSWELNFVVRGYLYGPTKNSSIIKQAITQFFDKDTEHRLDVVKVTATGGTGATGTGTGASFDPRYYGYAVQIFGATASDADIFDS